MIHGLRHPMFTPRIDSPLFRVALTVAALWIAYAAYDTKVKYSAAAYENTSYIVRTSEEAECDTVSKFTPTKDSFDITYEPNPRRDDCLSRIKRIWTGYKNERRQAVLWGGLKRGLIPAAIFLLLIAYLEAIISLLGGSASAYTRWVKGAPPGDEPKDAG